MQHTRRAVDTQATQASDYPTQQVTNTSCFRHLNQTNEHHTTNVSCYVNAVIKHVLQNTALSLKTTITNAPKFPYTRTHVLSEALNTYISKISAKIPYTVLEHFFE